MSRNQWDCKHCFLRIKNKSHVHLRVFPSRVCVRVSVYICVCVGCVFVCLPVYVFVWCVHVYVFVSVYVFVHVCICLCLPVHVYVFVWGVCVYMQSATVINSADSPIFSQETNVSLAVWNQAGKAGRKMTGHRRVLCCAGQFSSARHN